eukprot:6188439-Pleurochrysis_carterae.AAC.4
MLVAEPRQSILRPRKRWVSRAISLCMDSHSTTFPHACPSLTLVTTNTHACRNVRNSSNLKTSGLTTRETWRKTCQPAREAQGPNVAARAANNDAEALFALRRIKKLPPLAFGDTLAAHYQAVANDPARTAARARPP